MRRVVTGHDAAGRSTVAIEDQPDSQRLTRMDPEAHFASMGARAADQGTRRHPVLIDAAG